MKVLVTGGVRSGKSAHAESLLAQHPVVTYVAPGPAVEEDADPDWAARIAAHRTRRPSGWSTLETRELEEALVLARGPVLVDCLGTWLTAVLDDAAGWDRPVAELHPLVEAALAGFLDRLAATTETVVVVTNEVGLGVVPGHRSGRVFRDLLGTVNQAVAAVCDEVHLVVAGRVLVL
jgi:adenosylcobinamide kinase / adenosylcobinamide-phosphate guanylyltransferase